MSHHSRPRAMRALSAGVLAALTLGLTAGVPSSASAAATYTGSWSNTTSIAIPGSGDASPSPSVITVPGDSGITQVGDVSVTLKGLSHTAVDDLYVVLFSPSDTEVDLLCEQQVNGSYEPSNANVTFTTDGSGQDTCHDPDFDTDLLDLAGENPTGDWELYVFDAYDGDSGQIAGGWTLSLNQAAAPVVTAQPQDVSIPTNRLATFTAEASGAPRPFVQWQVSTDGGSTWNDVDQATERSFGVLTQQSDDGHQYRAEFYAPNGSVFTNAATLHINNSPSVPQNLTVNQYDEHAVRVSWAEPSEPGSGVWNYRVIASNGQTSIVRTAFSSPIDLDLPVNQTWAISVAALWGPGGTTEGPAATASIKPRLWPTISLSKTRLVSGDALVIKGTGLPHETLKIQKNVFPEPNYRDVLTVTTDAAGVFQVTTKVDYTATYHVLTPTGLYSNNLQPRVASTTSMAAKRLSTRKYTLSGTIAPRATGVPVKISYRKASGAYALLGTVKTSSTGKWSYTRKYTASKTMVFKASIAATPRNTAGYRLLSVKVR